MQDLTGYAHCASPRIAVVVIVARAILAVAKTTFTARVAYDFDCVIQRPVGAWVVLGCGCY